MAGKTKSVWDDRVTVHPTITEKTNTALLYLAQDKGEHKSRIIEKILLESEEVKGKIKELEADGFFQ